MSPLLKHYGFSAHPFSRGVCGQTLYRHPGFQEAFSRLRFTVELRSIAMLVAETGCGKSILMGELASELQTESWSVHYFAHSSVGPFSLINVLARKVGLSPRRSRGETATALSETLLESGADQLLVVDEAHQLPDESLEDIRLLTIADFDRKSPFVLLLAGQPTLDDRLGEPTHHALDQRVTTVARLAPLALPETREYIQMRLAATGAKKDSVFDDDAIQTIFDSSGGVPRRINNLATSALIVAAARRRRTVSAQDVQDAHLDRARP